MSQHYIDPKRADDKWSLPDLEVFHWSQADAEEFIGPDDEGNPPNGGWYYQFCLPGCMPDSDPFGPFGPFESEAAALDDARENFGDE